MLLGKVGEDGVFVMKGRDESRGIAIYDFI